MCCFSTKHIALRSTSKHWLVRNHYSVPEGSGKKIALCLPYDHDHNSPKLDWHMINIGLFFSEMHENMCIPCPYAYMCFSCPYAYMCIPCTCAYMCISCPYAYMCIPCSYTYVCSLVPMPTCAFLVPMPTCASLVPMPTCASLVPMPICASPFMLSCKTTRVLWNCGVRYYL